MKNTAAYSAAPAGFSYVEVMAALIVLSVALVPAIEALSGGPAAAAVFSNHTEQHHRLAETMEFLLAEAHSTLSAEASTPGSPSASAVYSDSGGTANRRLVYITTYDGDNADGDDAPFTGTDADLLWLRVEIENTTLALEALIAP